MSIVSIARLLTQDVKIISITDTSDADGNLISTTTVRQVKGLLQQRSDDRVGRELDLGREAAAVEWVLFLDAGTPLSLHDEVEIDSIRYQVFGEPERLNWMGREHHVEARLRRVI